MVEAADCGEGEEVSEPRQPVYYVGATTVEANGWARHTFEDAVAHAKRLSAQDGVPRNIVKVVGRVTRSEPPMKVENYERGRKRG